MNFIKKSADLILDSSCIICGSKDLSDKIGFICKKCLDTFDIEFENICSICGHLLNEDKTCPSCKNLGRVYFDSFRFLQFYTGNFKHIIRMWKMDDNFMINRLFHDLLINKNILDKNIPVMSVPDDFFKSFKKGRCSLSYLIKLLKKNGYLTKKNVLKKRFSISGSQKNKNRKQRKNLENLFFLDDKNIDNYSGEIYLIDDIYTTGSTMNYCAKLLKIAGFEKVHAISFFRSSLFDKD